MEDNRAVTTRPARPRSSSSNKLSRLILLDLASRRRSIRFKATDSGRATAARGKGVDVCEHARSWGLMQDAPELDRMMHRLPRCGPHNSAWGVTAAAGFIRRRNASRSSGGWSRCTRSTDDARMAACAVSGTKAIRGGGPPEGALLMPSPRHRVTDRGTEVRAAVAHEDCTRSTDGARMAACAVSGTKAVRGGGAPEGALLMPSPRQRATGRRTEVQAAVGASRDVAHDGVHSGGREMSLRLRQRSTTPLRVPEHHS